VGLVVAGRDAAVGAARCAVGQLSSLVGAPAAYWRQLPGPLAGINLQYGLTNLRAEQIKTMEVSDGRTELRAVTGPDYGRIYDHELVSAVQRIAGNGTGDTRWKVPGVLDWSTGIYGAQPNAQDQGLPQPQNRSRPGLAVDDVCQEEVAEDLRAKPSARGHSGG